MKSSHSFFQRLGSSNSEKESASPTNEGQGLGSLTAWRLSQLGIKNDWMLDHCPAWKLTMLRMLGLALEIGHESHEVGILHIFCIFLAYFWHDATVMPLGFCKALWGGAICFGCVGQFLWPAFVGPVAGNPRSQTQPAPCHPLSWHCYQTNLSTCHFFWPISW